MTAIVGILNKRAVAVAADSAVTIDCQCGHKVLNSASKLFQLSKKEPVGIMVYSSATFMDTPWELIISLYREYIEAKSFDTLKEYVGDFIQFLRDNEFFCSNELKKEFLIRQLIFYYNDVRSIAHQKCIEESGERQIPQQAVHNKMLQIFSEHITFYRSQPSCPDFTEYLLEEFIQDVQEELIKVREIYSPNVTDIDTFKKMYEEAFWAYLCSSHVIFDMSGLVFVGYGKNEIFPGLIPYNLSFAINGKLKGNLDESGIRMITDIPTAAICPFAQKDVMMTIMTGVDEDIKRFTYDTASKCMTDYQNYIVSMLSIDQNDRSAKEIVETLDGSTFVGFFRTQVDEFIQQAYIKKLVETVAYLEKDDLANMAENLILLTGLKKRITSSEETVGGPVDVAIISKGDGFIWMKKKQYFDKELNPHYSSYF